MKDKLTIGNKVYLKPINNNGRFVTDKPMEEYEIKSIGNKYFFVWRNKEDWTIEKFHIDGLRQATEYSPDWQLYLSLQEFKDEEEKKNLEENIRKRIKPYGDMELSLGQLRKIWEIIDRQ